jgi:hypothetical protein
LNEVNNHNLDPKQSEFSNMCKMTEQVKSYWILDFNTNVKYQL